MLATSTEVPLAAVGEIAEPVEGNYFVAAYPPFSVWRKELVETVRQRLQSPDQPAHQAPFGLYVHIPFCVHRCQYCYYLSYAGQALQQMEPYLDAVIGELARYRGMPAFAGRAVSFVYFGGGTPSLLPIESIQRLLLSLREVFPWDGAEEVTFEGAPRSLNPAKLQVLRQAGVNRLSLGVQQLNDEVLRLNGRVHLVADVERAWEEIGAGGFDEVNVDLIAGLVGETEATFRDSLEQVIRMGPDSVTIYPLEIPGNTPLHRALSESALEGELPTWPVKRDRVAYAFARLEEAGYTLRSAYAASRNTRHARFVYQEDQYRGVDLLGLGVSSLSYVAGAHYQNLASLDSYLAAVQAGRLPIGRAYLLSTEERLVREFVLQLKLGRVEAGPFRHKFGVEISDWFAQPLSRCHSQGWLNYDRQGVTLTRAGLLRADRLLSAFYLPEHRGLCYW